MTPSLLTAVLIFAAAAFFLLICREIVAWYFKINTTVGLLQRIDERLATLDERLGEVVDAVESGSTEPAAAVAPANHAAGAAEGIAPTAPGPASRCAKCSAPLPPPGRFCAQCGARQEHGAAH